VVPLIKRQDAIINEKIRLLAFSFSPFLVCFLCYLRISIKELNRLSVKIGFEEDQFKNYREK
jgi:hypothetical protein